MSAFDPFLPLGVKWQLSTIADIEMSRQHGEMSTLADLQQFLCKLQDTNTSYRLTSEREGAVMVHLALPGERWEVEFFPDRELEIEIFKADGDIHGAQKVVEFWEANV